MQYELIRLKRTGNYLYICNPRPRRSPYHVRYYCSNEPGLYDRFSPEDIYNEPKNAFVADFIGESNILPAIMVDDKLVNIFGTNFPCVDTGFGKNKPVDVVIRPEDIDLVKPEEGIIKGVVTSLLFKGVHYEMEVHACGHDWLVHSTDLSPVGSEVGIWVDPFDIQIMNKPESEDEEAVEIEL